MKIKLRYFLTFSFIFEFICYALCLFLALGTALHLAIRAAAQTLGSSQFSWNWWQFLLTFLIATLILLLILKYFHKPWLVKILFYLGILEGLWYFSQTFFSWPYSLIIFAFLALYWLANNHVFIHNVMIILAISAISAFLGMNLDVISGLIILIALAIYDYWAVYKTKHMVAMFRGLAESKVHFSLIIPQDWQGLFKPVALVDTDKEFMFLGTGDLALPALFVVACLKISLLAALITGLGALAGFVFLFVIFIHQPVRKPMPGLPPIVLGTLLGFLIAILL